MYNDMLVTVDMTSLMSNVWHVAVARSYLIAMAAGSVTLFKHG